jgi:hypothetical protein
MRNLFDGKKKLRLLDIKIGQATADANWRGTYCATVTRRSDRVSAENE